MKLQLTVRTYKEEVRKKILASIERIAKAEAVAAGAPREPLVETTLGFEATYNDPALTQRIARALAAAFGPSRVVELPPLMAAEDFGDFGRAARIPSLIFWLGAVEPRRFEAAHGDATRLPGLHSSEWAPDREPTLKTGAEALTIAVLELLGKP